MNWSSTQCRNTNPLPSLKQLRLRLPKPKLDLLKCLGLTPLPLKLLYEVELLSQASRGHPGFFCLYGGLIRGPWQGLSLGAWRGYTLFILS